MTGYILLDATYQRTLPNDPENRFGIKSGVFQISGSFHQNKLGFLLALNFVDAYPLLDAWIYYQPIKGLKLSAGQRQAITATRSTRYRSDTHALGAKSLSNCTFFGSGRELGLFAEHRHAFGSFGYDLGLSVTSGDGRNSFGTTTDFDLGGLKYGAQATIYPLGFFTRGNERVGSDFIREERPKLAIGVGYGYNVGASDPIGAGHGTFTLYNSEGKQHYPDYQTITADLLFKYRGFTFLAEYTNAIAANLQDIYTSTAVTSKLQPKQIANYLKLGNGLSFQAGYIFPSKWAIDGSYSTVLPEWREAPGLLEKMEEYRLGIGKYVIDNRAKVQLVGNYIKAPNSPQIGDFWSAQLLFHVVF